MSAAKSRNPAPKLRSLRAFRHRLLPCRSIHALACRGTACRALWAGQAPPLRLQHSLRGGSSGADAIRYPDTRIRVARKCERRMVLEPSLDLAQDFPVADVVLRHRRWPAMNAMKE